MPDMVTANLEGRKDVTRRVITSPSGFFSINSNPSTGDRWVEQIDADEYSLEKIIDPFPVGAILWGRERFRLVSDGRGLFMQFDDLARTPYLEEIAPSTEVLRNWIARYERYASKKLYPAMHMPRFACRIFDEIVDSSPQRLHDITEEDAIREGIEQVGVMWRDYSRPINKLARGSFVPCLLDPIESYRTLWDSINLARGKGWETNPWVWRVEKRRIAKPATA